MAKILDILGEEIIDEVLSGAHLILVLPEYYVLAQQIQHNFKQVDFAHESTAPGLYYFRATNDFNRGLIIGQLASSLKDFEIYSGRQDVIHRYLPHARVVPLDVKQQSVPMSYSARPSNGNLGAAQRYPVSNPTSTFQSIPTSTVQSIPTPTVQSNPIPAYQSNPIPTYQSNPILTYQSNPTPTIQPNLPSNIGRNAINSGIGKTIGRAPKKSPLENIYIATLHKYIDCILGDPSKNQVKSKSVKNQLKNYCSGAIKSNKDISGEVPNEEDITSLIINDLIYNEVFEEYGMEYLISVNTALECFRSRKKPFITCFERQKIDDKFENVVRNIDIFVKSNRDLLVFQLYEKTSEAITYAYPDYDISSCKEMVKSVMKSVIEQNNLYGRDINTQEILENPTSYSNMPLLRYG